MRLTRFLVLATSLALLGGCGAAGRMVGPPSKTTLPAYLPAGTPAGEKVAVCYGGATSSMKELAAAAAEFCGEPGSTVSFVTEDLYLNECPLMKKRRAVFACREPR